MLCCAIIDGSSEASVHKWTSCFSWVRAVRLCSTCTVSPPRWVNRLLRANNNTFMGINVLPLVVPLSPKSRIMAIPKFLVGDNTDHPESVFIIHTEFPRFVMDLDTDEIEWLDDVAGEDQGDLTDEMASLLVEANAFYEREVEHYENLD